MKIEIFMIFFLSFNNCYKEDNNLKKIIENVFSETIENAYHKAMTNIN